MPGNHPSIILSSFACSGASAISGLLESLLPPLGYYVTPFGIEGSGRICTEIAGTHDPFFHFTHAAPGLFEPLLSDPKCRLIYQYRDPRDAAVSWAFNEIAAGNTDERAEFAGVLHTIITSKYHLAEHVARAREWFALGEAVCSIRFEDMKADKPGTLEKVLGFSGLGDAVDAASLTEAFASNSDANYRASQQDYERRLRERGIERAERGTSGGWKTQFTPTEILLFKKIAGDFLIETGYESDFDW